MMFMLSCVGLALGIVVGYPLAQVSVGLSALVAGLGCVIGLEIGSRIAGRHVDPATWAFRRPSSATYGNVAGIISTVSPVVVFAEHANWHGF